MLGKKGFSIIEIMIVITITGILVATVMVNSGRNPDRDVRLEKDRLTTFVRDVENMSLSTERPSKDSAPGCYDADDKFTCSLCGFGIKKDASGYIQSYFVIKASVNDDCQTLVGGDGVDYAEKIFIPRNGVTISSGIETSDRIFFLSPNARIYDGGDPMTEDKTITLSKTDGLITADMDVTITPGGVVK